MSITNYTELKTAISGWLAKGTTYDGQIDDFIDLAEAEFNRQLRLDDMEAEEEIETVAAQEYIEPDTEFLGIPSLQLSGQAKGLTYTTRKQLSDSYGGNSSGRPKQYAKGVGNKIILGPTPDGVYTIIATGYEKIPALSVSNTTNWLLTKSPDLYLFMCLAYANLYVKNMQGADEWRNKANGIIASMISENEIDKETRAVMYAQNLSGNP
jgi:hypothetical protein